MHKRIALRTLSLAALTALAFAASPPSAPAANERAATANERAATAHAARCTRASDQAGGTSALHEISSGGHDREFILRLPKGYERRSDWPLIVAFHGRGSTGPEVEGYSKLSRLPAVVAYPEGLTGTGDGYRQAWQGAPYEPPGVDDVAFTSDLLDELQSTLCVDTDRTYATGKSNGAGLVGLLACRLPDRFAAVAPVSGAFYPQSRAGCDDAAPMPVLDIHGTGDTTIPYAGDADRDLPAIRDWVDGWVARDGCAATPRTARTGKDITTYRWHGCSAGTEVEHVAVTGGGHVWPGADVYSGGGYVTHTVQAHRLIWRFFLRHSLDERTTR